MGSSRCKQLWCDALNKDMGIAKRLCDGGFFFFFFWVQPLVDHLSFVFELVELEHTPTEANDERLRHDLSRTEQRKLINHTQAKKEAR